VPAHNGTFTTVGEPGHVTLGPDGNVWFAQAGSAKEFAKIAPNGTITEYDTPTDMLSLQYVTAGPDVAGGPNNRIYFSYTGGVLEVDPATGAATEHSVAEIQGAQGIAPDGDGNLWIVDAGVPTGVVKVKPNGAGAITVLFDKQILGTGGRAITRGSDGRMWWADPLTSSVHATNVNGPTYTDTPYGVGGMPQEITAGPAGQLGFSNPGANPQLVGRMALNGTEQYTQDPMADPFGVVLANDGAYWFAQFNRASVARLTTGGALTQPVPLPAVGGRWISKGANNTLWVAAPMDKKIYRITGVEPPPPPKPPTTPNPPTPPGGGGGGATDTAKPKITRAKFSVSKRRLTLTLDEAASLRLRVDQRLKGRRRAGKCRKPRRNAKPNCRYWKQRRSALAEGEAGINRIPLGRKFGRGAYRLVVRATDRAGNVSKKTIRFKVKAKKRKRR
jgi:streptogramin lyase